MGIWSGGGTWSGLARVAATRASKGRRVWGIMADGGKKGRAGRREREDIRRRRNKERLGYGAREGGSRGDKRSRRREEAEQAERGLFLIHLPPYARPWTTRRPRIANPWLRAHTPNSPLLDDHLSPSVHLWSALRSLPVCSRASSRSYFRCPAVACSRITATTFPFVPTTRIQTTARPQRPISKTKTSPVPESDLCTKASLGGTNPTTKHWFILIQSPT